MWTADHFDNYLQKIASQQPNEDFVLSGYLNHDAQSREHFERRVSRLRNTIPATRSAAFYEGLNVARQLLKRAPKHQRASAFFVRGGPRMYVYQIPLALPTSNRLCYSRLPALYPLFAVRDNLDQFSLLHIQHSATTLSHFELGSLHVDLNIRATYRSVAWRYALTEIMRQLNSRKSRVSRANWIIAAPADILDKCKRIVRGRIELLPVDPAADPQSVRQLALNHFRDREEAQSRRLAHTLIKRKRKGQPVQLGAFPVLEALATTHVQTLVLHALSPEAEAPRWDADEEDPFFFHDQAVWLARRGNTHVEIVNESEELSLAGGSACL
jgi:hypothetical protein